MRPGQTDGGGLRRLKQRGEFLRAARGQRAGRKAFVLQAADSGSPDVGVGFTVTKKMGNAPERNRIKRRLRAVATACARDFGAGKDYVLIGRREALGEPFQDLVASLSRALKRLERSRDHDNPRQDNPSALRAMGRTEHNER